MSIRVKTLRVRKLARLPRRSTTGHGGSVRAPTTPLRRGGRAAVREKEAQPEPSPPTDSRAHEAEATDVVEVIEYERRRLRQARSLIVCARFALVYSDFVEEEWELDVADVVEMAGGLLRETLANLDRVMLLRSNEDLDPVSRPRGSRKTRARPRSATD